MARENVNPKDNISSVRVTPDKVAGKNEGSRPSRRADVNPNDDIFKAPITNSSTPSYNVPQSKRVAVNPKTEFQSSGTSGEGVLEEEKPAVMPSVGEFPTPRKNGKRQGGE